MPSTLIDHRRALPHRRHVPGGNLIVLGLKALLLLTALTLTADATAASGEEPLAPAERDEFLAGLENSLQQVDSVLVRFRQERHLELFFEPVISEGVLAFARPDRLHWEWVRPYPSLLVLNNRRIVRFDVENGVLQRMRPAGKEMMQSVAVQMTRWLQGKFRESSDLFSIEVYPGPPARVVLTPRSPELGEFLSRIELRLAEGVRVDEVRLFSPNGDRTIMGFIDEQRHLELDNQLFDLEHPRLIGGS